MNKEVIFMAAVAIATVAGPVIASPATETKSVSVSIKGLDRNDPQDMAVLYKRIVDAADNACALEPVTGTRIASVDGLDACMKSAVANTVEAVGSRELNKIHRAELAQTNAKTKVAIR